MENAERSRIQRLTRATLPAALWFADVPIRFGHCDAAGIVFTPRYFDILHEAVERFFCDALRIDYYRVLTERRVGLGYVQAACDFFKPSRMGDRVEVGIMVERIGRASYTLTLPVLREGVEVVRGRLITAPTSLDTMSSIPIPPDIRTALEGYRDRCATVPTAAL